MIYTSIIPDRQVVLILPPVPDLQVMIFGDQSHKPIQRSFAFVLGQAVDMLHMVPNSEDRLPACNGVGADHGVRGN
jgi:hypothetical protein